MWQVKKFGFVFSAFEMLIKFCNFNKEKDQWVPKIPHIHHNAVSWLDFLDLFFNHVTYNFRVCLEWNSLGLDSDRFTLLAEGISANNSLERLDLRNNQISHDGASELMKSLQRNCALQSVGKIRWVFMSKCHSVEVQPWWCIGAHEITAEELCSTVCR